MTKINIQTQIIGPHVIKQIDSLAVAALDGILRAVAVVDLLDTDSLAWLHAQLVDAEKGTTGLHGVLSAMRDLVHAELAGDHSICTLFMSDCSLVACNLDGPDTEMHCGTQRVPAQNGGTHFMGTRDQLLGVLYVVESAPSDDPLERAALTTTKTSWRARLGISDDRVLDVPAWAKAKPTAVRS